MSTQIIAAFRTLPQLRGNTLLIATELAHRMNGQGYGRVSYQFLAWKAHCSRITAIRQIAKLITLGLLRKTVLRTKEGYAWNLYVYLGTRRHTASPPVSTHGNSLHLTLPEPEREKDTALGETLRNQQKTLRALTPGCGLWLRIAEEIARLEALLPPLPR